MHIKQVLISGFRSFRNQGEIEPFSPAHNAIVGRNGSGKSNLFDAIQFALLAPKFAVLRQEERSAMLHEGAGASVMSAFCEIVFDNSDGRLSVDGDEVVLRRTIGLKKDEFFLNRKRVNRNDVSSLLESAGFSKSNPYYIVQQGKVNSLCLMTDTERLQLLKEVAGTTVYDEKRSESVKQMSENSLHREKINEVISYIQERLDDLEGEKEELTAYQKVDKERRALEYTLYDKELRRAREALDQLEHARSDDAEASGELYEAARVTSDGIASIERQMKQTVATHNRATADLKSLDAELTASVTRRAQLELEVTELKKQAEADGDTQKKTEAALKKVESEIEDAKNRMRDVVGPAYDAAKKALIEISGTKDNTFEKIKGMYAKQGRGSEYTTEKDRDEYLKNVIKELEGSVAEKQGYIAGQEDDLAAMRRMIESEENGIKEFESDITKKHNILSKITQQLQEKTSERNTFAEDRRERWRAIEDVADKLVIEKEAQARADGDLRKAMPRATASGLDALADMVEKDNIKGYYGTIMDNFTLIDDKFRTAVEVSAGNALFHVIVDNDDTAAKLMQKLEDKKLGRITFMPLSRLRVPESVTYPDSNDVVPIMTRCIKFNPVVKAAMTMVFGKKLLAKNIDSAALWSKNFDMDAVTLDGDEVNSKGALHGGFVDTSRSKLAAYDAVQKAKGNVDKLDKEQRDLQQKATAVDQTIANLMGEMQKLEAKKANLQHILETSAKEQVTKKASLEKRIERSEALAETLPSMRFDVEGLELQIGQLQEEIGTPLSATLNAEERAKLTELHAAQKEQEVQLEEQTTKTEEAAAEKNKLQSLLRDNLSRLRSELLDSLTPAVLSGGNTVGSEISERKERLESRRADLEIAERSAEACEQRASEAKATLNEAKTNLSKAKTQLDELKAKDLANQQAIEEAGESAEKLLNKRSMCVSKRELYMKKIQELGSLPSSELAAHAELSIKDLMKSLDTCNKGLKKYSHVNKKAYDQYVNFSEQRESLLSRKEELDVGAKKVTELIESLDTQKDEAINRTFRGVSAHFKDVFKELCPEGSGELVMKTNLDEEDDETSTKDGSNTMDVSLFRGVSINVRFTANGDNFIMSQLSGGQKALVALALIFAIQRCDPAPFYLFDELDQALDSTHRAAVAALIQRQASSEENPTQFITSTFRPELVSVASRCYGISHQNKVSNIHQLTKKDGLSFIANLMSEEENVVAPAGGNVSRMDDEVDQENVDVNVEEEEAEPAAKAAPAKRARKTRA
jgi:structural maintenance of chromosome 3 (chondroitin sulfate proteoglycan 6)